MNRSHAEEMGWSLPFIPIILILIVAVVMLFFGTLRWIGLVILGLFAIVSAIGAISIILHKGKDKGPQKPHRAGN